MLESALSDAQPDASPAVTRKAYAEYLVFLNRDRPADFDQFCRERPDIERELRQLHQLVETARSIASSRRLHEAIRQQVGDVNEIRLALHFEPGLSIETNPIEPPGTGPPIVAARYVNEGAIARGGMGVIYRIRDRDLNRTLAMKVMSEPKSRGTGPGSIKEESQRLNRFLEEAQVTAQLDHPGIVPIHELGIDSQCRVYFTMKLVKGREFGRIIELARREEDGWNLPRAIGVLVKACQAVAFAHERRVIHRDLKPANIMAGRFGETYVMDWGLAKVVGRKDIHDIRVRSGNQEPRTEIETEQSISHEAGDDSPLMTMDGEVIGTPAYMAPEQASGRIEVVDAASDVYSLGAILYHLLTGQAPYNDPAKLPSPRTVLNAVVAGPPRPVAVLNSSASPELTAICRKAMKRDKADRYTSAAELAEELQAFLDRRVVHAYRTGPVAESWAWVTRNRTTASAAVVATLLLLAGAASVVLVQHRADQSFRQRFYAFQTQRAAAAVAAGQFSHLNEILSECPVEHRRWEWNYLRHQVDRWNTQTFFRSREPAEALAVSPIGDLVAFVTADNLLHVRRYPTGQQLFTTSFPSDSEACLVFSPKGDALVGTAARTGGAVTAWNPTTGEVLKAFPHERPVQCLAFSPDGRLLATGGDALAVRVWDFSSVAPFRLLSDATNAQTLTFTHDGKTLLAGTTQGTIDFWDVASQRRIRSLKSRFNRVRNLCLSKDNRLLVCGHEHAQTSQGELTLWHLDKGWSEDLGKGTGMVGAVFNADDRWIAAAGWEGQIRLWNTGTGEQTAQFQAHAGRCTGIAFLPDGSILTSGADGTIAICRANHPGSDRLVGHKLGVRVIQFSPDSRWLASAGLDATIKLWDVARAREWTAYAGHATSAVALAWSPNGRSIVSGSLAQDLRCWDPFDGRTRWTQPLRPGTGAWYVAYSRDGRHIITGSSDGTISLWDAATGSRLGGPHSTGVTNRLDGVALSPDDRFVAAGYQNRDIILWDARSWEERWKVPAKFLRCLAFSRDGTQLAHANSDGTISLRDPKSGRLLLELRRHEAAVNTVVFSPDGDRLFSGGADGTVRVWNPRTGQELLRLELPGRRLIWSVDLSPDGRTLAAADGEGMITLWKSD